MKLGKTLRGQPLSVLSLVLGGWVALRVFTWAPPQWEVPPADAIEMPQLAFLTPDEDDGGEWLDEAGFERGPVTLAQAVAYAPPQAPIWGGGPPMDWSGVMPVVQPVFRRIPIPVPAYYPMPVGPEGGFAGVPSHPMWGAGMVPGAIPPATPRDMNAQVAYGGQSVADAPAPVPLSPGLAEGKVDRWSADTWVLARRESPFPPASGRPVYGGSQAGAVLRYRLAPESAYRPMAYLRANTALGAIRENEIALGVAARPFPSIPIVAAAEARAFRSGTGRKSFRPAALVYTELPPAALPGGFTGEAYAQGGYVGGAYRTVFVDGQLRVERPLIDVAGMKLRVGGGVWGGAQKGASRLDIGPSASTIVDIWGMSSRVSMDWRFRLLGDAEPKSGPAVTISAGF